LPVKTDFNWWQERAQLLKGAEDQVGKIEARTHRVYEPGPWAIMKLALVGYYVQIYTNILGKTRTINYVDLFAGPGVNRIRRTHQLIMGSPLLAEFAPERNHFTNLVLCEKDRENAQALRTILPKAIVIDKDINFDGLTDLVAFLKSHPGHSLVLADPEGLQLHFNTLTSVLDVTYSDIMMNYQPTSVNRVLGQVAQNPSMEESLTKFFGTPDWKNGTDGDQLLNLYCDQLAKFRDNILTVKVQGTRLFHYYVILGTRKVKSNDSGQEEWVKSFARAKERVERVDAQTARSFLEIVTGNQTFFDIGEQP
jgi:three-Cys-motif partner protein